MQASTLRALTMGILLVFSALAGCIDADSDGGSSGDEQTILVSTYHIEQLVSAIAQDSVNVEIISPSNVPVHDYEPSAMDLVKLQQADLFFYHGLNLEPWVDSTLESLGVDSPNAISTHSMPTGESNLDYESLLIGDICEHLSEGPYEDVELSESSEHADDAELHAEHVAFNLSFHFEDDEDHDHNETEEHDEHDHEEGEHDEHDEHEEHGIEAEEVEESPAECPADTNVYLFHFEEGEYIIEFMHHDVDSFNMVILQMAGAHNHEHDHEEEGEHDEHDHEEEEGEHDEHEHEEEGEHDEHEHDEEEEITAEHALEEFDTNNDSHLSWDEFWASWEEDDHDENTTTNNTSDNQTSSNETHDEEHEDEMEHLMEMFNDSDMDSDGLLNMTELEEFIEHLMDEFLNEDHADGYAILHIEEEGEYGIGIHADIDFAIIGEEHDEHDHEEEGEHDEHDHEEEEGEHDEHEHEEEGEHDEHDHEEEGEHDEHDHDEEGVAFDPHSWLDPLAYKAQLEIVLEAMVIAFPTLEDTFRANALEYSNQLDGLHSNFEEAFGESGVCTDRTVVANHNAYAYMAERYDLDFVTVHGLDPEGEPSAEDIAEVIEEIEEQDITVLFIEEYTDADAVSSIVSQTVSDDLPNGVSVEYLYTMEMPPMDSTQNYLSLMQSNLDNLKSGLGC